MYNSHVSIDIKKGSIPLIHSCNHQFRDFISRRQKSMRCTPSPMYKEVFKSNNENFLGNFGRSRSTFKFSTSKVNKIEHPMFHLKPRNDNERIRDSIESSPRVNFECFDMNKYKSPTYRETKPEKWMDKVISNLIIEKFYGLGFR